MLSWFFEAIASTSAVMVFFSIFLVGTTAGLLSLLFGGHGDADHDMSHDMDHASDHGGDSHDHDTDTGVTHFFSVGMLSVRGVTLFATGFGGAGAIAQLYTKKVLFSTVIGTIVGYAFAFILLLIVRSFKSQQSNSLISTDSAVGTNGIIITSIPVSGPGEVKCVLGGVEVTKMAISKNGSPIKSGTRVQIDSVDGATFVVVPLNAA
jgi:hypothetical protein